MTSDPLKIEKEKKMFAKSMPENYVPETIN